MTHLLLTNATKVAGQVSLALNSFQMLTSMFLKPVKVLIGCYIVHLSNPSVSPLPSNPLTGVDLGEVPHMISIQIFPYDNCSQTTPIKGQSLSI